MSLTQRQITAAISAITAMLAGEDYEGDWSPDVTRRDLEGALAKLQAAQQSVEPTVDNVGEKPTVSKSYPNELPA